MERTALVDIGINLAHDSYDHDRAEVVARAVAAGVERMVVTGSSLESAAQAIAICRRWPALMRATAGIHPHHAQDLAPGDLPALADSEQLFGDGAAAMLIGSSGVAASVEGVYSLSEEFMDTWRKQDDDFVQKGDASFVQAYGYARMVPACVHGILKKYEMKISDIAQFIIPAPDARVYARVTKSLNLPAGSFPEDPLLTTVGDTGSAAPLMLLASALERAKPGERVLLCSYGAGNGDAFLLQVTPEVERLKDRRGVSYYQASKKPLANYEKFLKFQNTLPNEPQEPYSSWALLWKEKKQNLQLYGTRCKKCGTFAFPRRRVCLNCYAKDEYEDARLPRIGKIYTFAKDHLFPNPDPPTVMAVADMEGGQNRSP